GGALAGAGAARADVFYLRSAVGDPWDSQANQQAMDQAFGSGRWTQANFEEIDVDATFSRSTVFVWLEGGDDNALELEAFLDTNRDAIEAWVEQGGGLYLNAAPNEGDGMELVFGRSLLYPYSDQEGGGTFATSLNTAHPVWNGPFLPVNVPMTGGGFAHASIMGEGTPLLQDESGNEPELMTFDAGSGGVALGGLTSWNF